MEYVLIIALTPVLFSLAVLLENRIMFVILCTIPAYVGYLLGLKNSVLSAFVVLLIWTFIQSSLVIFSSLRSTTKMAKLIFRSEPYTESMFRWIETGILPEGNSLQVIRTHIQQSLLYCGLALITGNLVSLIFGCMLLNYMNFYVSQLAARNKSWKVVCIWLESMEHRSGISISLARGRPGSAACFVHTEDECRISIRMVSARNCWGCRRSNLKIDNVR